MNPLLSLRRGSFFLAAIVGLAALATVHGQSTLVSTQVFDLSGGDVPTNLTFAAFNPSLGNLQSVALSYNGTQRFDFSFWATAPNDIDYSYQANFTNATHHSSLTLGGISQVIPASAPLTGTVTLAPLDSAVINQARAAASTAFFSGIDPTPGVDSSGGNSVYGTLPFAGAFTLSNAFNGSLSAQFQPFTTASLSGGNFAQSQFQDFTGTATVTYTYIAIPEPATYAALLGTAIFGVTLRRRRTA